MFPLLISTVSSIHCNWLIANGGGSINWGIFLILSTNLLFLQINNTYETGDVIHSLAWHILNIYNKEKVYCIVEWLLHIIDGLACNRLETVHSHHRRLSPDTTRHPGMTPQYQTDWNMLNMHYNCGAHSNMRTRTPTVLSTRDMQWHLAI